MQDEGSHDLDDLGAARRRAFSRGATEADLVTLRRLEQHRLEQHRLEQHRREEQRREEHRREEQRRDEHAAVTSAGAPAGVTDTEHAGAGHNRSASPDPDPDPDPDRDLPPARGTRSWIRPAALGLTVGALLGILLATVTSPLFGVRRSESVSLAGNPDAVVLDPSLAIFDRTPSERDILAAAGYPQIFDPDAGTPEVRWLADVDGATIYVARGDLTGETAICLFVVRTTAASGSCSGVAEFEAAGITGDFDGVVVRWGPHGVDPWVPYEPQPR
jgi:hypothetical protein